MKHPFFRILSNDREREKKYSNNTSRDITVRPNQPPPKDSGRQLSSATLSTQEQKRYGYGIELPDMATISSELYPDMVTLSSDPMGCEVDKLQFR